MCVLIAQSKLLRRFGVKNITSLKELFEFGSPSLNEYHLNCAIEEDSTDVYFDKSQIQETITATDAVDLHYDYSEQLFIELKYDAEKKTNAATSSLV